MKSKFFIISILILSLNLSQNFKVNAMEKSHSKTFFNNKVETLNNTNELKIRKSAFEKVNLKNEKENKKESKVKSSKEQKNEIQSNANNNSLTLDLTEEDNIFNKNDASKLFDLVYNFIEIDYKKGFIKNVNFNDKKSREMFYKELGKYIENFRKAIKLITCNLEHAIEVKDKYSSEKEYNYFGKEKVKEMFKNFIEQFVKTANPVSVYEAINQDEKVELSEYIKTKQKKMLEKYKDNIYFNIEKLWLSVNEQLDFLFEIEEMFNFLIQYYKDFFFYKEKIKSYEEEGYKIKDLVKKIRNDFVIYEDEETKINVIYATKGKKLKHFIYFRNPSEKVKNMIETAKQNIRNNSVEIYVDENGGIRVVYDDLNEDFLRKIYPFIKQQYYENSNNMLFFIKDVTINFFPTSDEFVDENLKRYTMLKILKDHLFTKLYNDEYEINFDYNKQDEEEKDLNTNLKKDVSFNLKVIKDEGIFYDVKENFKYIAKVKYFLDCLARFKDIFNMNSEFINKRFEKLLRSNGFYNFLIKPQNEKDLFEVNFYGYEVFFENKENFLNKVNKFMNKFVEDLTKQIPPKNYEDLYSSNNTIRLFRSYLNDEEKLEKYFKERDNGRKLKDNELAAVKDMITGFVKENNGHNYENTIIAASTVPIDWSEKYRGEIPFIDLITKSFSKYKEPFSNKVMDVDSPFINDYVLRVYENLVDGINVLKETINNNMISVEVLKNLDY